VPFYPVLVCILYTLIVLFLMNEEMMMMMMMMIVQLISMHVCDEIISADAPTSTFESAIASKAESRARKHRRELHDVACCHVL